MIFVDFQFIDKFGRALFLHEIFLLSNISIEILLKISSLTFSNANN